MGAHQFTHKAYGANANEAFMQARKEAQYRHGHGGYTGTIAEKHDFEMIDPEGQDPNQFIANLPDEAWDQVDDKWGPAGCVDLHNGLYFFFGWASS
jgi:hypothetical protein